jgi:hypothetical protein
VSRRAIALVEVKGETEGTATEDRATRARPLSSILTADAANILVRALRIATSRPCCALTIAVCSYVLSYGCECFLCRRYE